MYTPPAGTRLILLHENMVQHTFGTRAADGGLLSYEWGEPDPETGISDLTVIKSYDEVDLENEALFLTSNSRLMAALLAIYPNRPEDAVLVLRGMLRQLTYVDKANE